MASKAITPWTSPRAKETLATSFMTWGIMKRRLFSTRNPEISRSGWSDGHEHLDVSASYNVAMVYEAQGKYEEALEMHAKSLDIRTRILGSVL